MNDQNPVEFKICRACGKEKSIKQFNKQKDIGCGYVARCKQCVNSGTLIPKNKIKNNGVLALTLTGLKEGDYVDMYNFFERIGYSLDMDIHEQFCLKHGLKPSHPKQKFNYHFTAKDLGLA